MRCSCRAPGLTIVGKNGTIGGEKRAAGVPLACLRRRAWHVCGGCFPAVMMSGGVAGLACCGIVSPAGVVGLLTSGGLLAVLMSRPGADDRG